MSTYIENGIEEKLTPLKFTTDLSPDPFICFDENGRFIFVNEAAQTTFGFTAEESTGLSMSDVVYGYSENQFKATVSGLLKDRKARFESKYIHRDGSVMHVDVVAIVQKLDGVELFCASVRDISDRVKSEQQLHQLYCQLSNSNRLSALDELASNIAHELTQPLTSLSTNAYVLKQLIIDGGLQEKGSEKAAKIESLSNDITAEALSAGEIIHRLRGFVSGRTDDRNRIDLASIITVALNILAPQFQNHSTKIKFVQPMTAMPVNVDSVQIRQIVLNLIAYSLDSMSTIADQERELTIQTGQTPEFYTLTFRDTGPPISTTDQATLFQPFFAVQGKENRMRKENEMRLGLSSSHLIAQSHGGRLEFNADYRDGAEFILSLPRVEPES